MNPDIKIGYQEHSLEAVLKYFAAGFKPMPGVTVVSYETFVDVNRGVVVFKISMRKDDPDTIITLQ